VLVVERKRADEPAGPHDRFRGHPGPFRARFTTAGIAVWELAPE
jgi:hypothetical protein